MKKVVERVSALTEDFENRKESILENILEKLADNYGVNAKDINITILGGK